MTKIITTICLDAEVVEQARHLNLNISQTCNDALKAKAAIIKGDVNDINKELLAIDITKLQNELSQKSITLNSKLEQMRKIEVIETNKIEESLKKEKERIENSKKCVICKFPKADAVKMHIFPIGQVCNSCFMEKRDAGKWFKPLEA